MTIAEIIPLAYRGCPPIECHDATREAMEADARIQAERSRVPQGGGRRGNPGGENPAARAKRDTIRAAVWARRDADVSRPAIAAEFGVSVNTIARILREGRGPAECMRIA